MAKIKIEFDTEVDDQRTINCAIKSTDLALCILEIQDRLRTIRKYREYDTEAEAETVDKIITELYELIDNQIGNISDYTY